MLYFKIVPDSEANTISPLPDGPYHLRVQKSNENEKLIYSLETGTNSIFIELIQPQYWQDHIVINAHYAEHDHTCKTEEQQIIQSGLFYFRNEYTMEFLEGRFINDLVTVYRNFNDFDSGAIWNALVTMNLLMAKYNNISTQADLFKFQKSIRNTLSILDKSIGLISKLACIGRDCASNYPNSIHNTKQFAIRKAYLALVYLFLLPIKEHFSDFVFNADINFLEYLQDCLPKHMNLGALSAAYEIMFESEEESIMSMLIKSPGRK